MKFDLILTNITYGWMSINYKINNLTIYTSGSGVFNPIQEFESLIISLRSSQLYTMLYDQEGSDLEFKILDYYKDMVFISICDQKDLNPSWYKHKNLHTKNKHRRNIKKVRFWINRKQLINNLVKNLELWDRKILKPYNKTDHEGWYDFDFSIKRVKFGKFTKKYSYGTEKRYKNHFRIYPLQHKPYLY